VPASLCFSPASALYIRCKQHCLVHVNGGGLASATGWRLRPVSTCNCYVSVRFPAGVGCSVFFLTDSIHISRLPRHLSSPQQQLTVFADQLAPYNPAAAAACLAALDTEAAASWAAAAAAAAASGSSPRRPGSSSSSSSLTVMRCGGLRVSAYSLPDASKLHWLQSDSQQQQELRQRRSSSGSSGSDGWQQRQQLAAGVNLHPHAPCHGAWVT